MASKIVTACDKCGEVCDHDNWAFDSLKHNNKPVADKIVVCSSCLKSLLPSLVETRVEYKGSSGFRISGRPLRIREQIIQASVSRNTSQAWC